MAKDLSDSFVVATPWGIPQNFFALFRPEKEELGMRSILDKFGRFGHSLGRIFCLESSNRVYLNSG